MMLATLRKFFLGTLRRRLIFGVAAVQAVLMLLFIADLARRHSTLLTQRQREQVTASVHTLAGAASGLMASNDLAALQELVEAQRRTPGLRYAMFLDEDGHILAHTDALRVGQYLRDLPPLAQQGQVLQKGMVLEGFAPIMIANHHLGWIYLSMDQREAQGRLAGLTRDGVLYSLVAILVGSLLAWLLGSRVVRRLSVLQSAIHKVQEGGAHVRSTLTGTDEVAALSVGFNRMLDQLDQRDAVLKNSEESYRRQFTDNSSIMLMIDPNDGRILEANTTAVAFYGYSREQLLALNIGAINQMPHGQLQAALDSVGTNQNERFEFQHRLADGSLREVQVSASRIQLGERHVLHSIIHDITERKQAVAALKKREEQFRSLAENSTDVIFTLDAQSTFLFVSPAWERHFGYPVSGVLGQPFPQFVHPEDVQPCLDLLTRVLANGQSATSPPFRVRHADGSWRWFMANGSRMSTPEGGFQFMGVGHDITERLHLEKTSLFLAQAEWLTTGEDFFAALGRFLAQHLAMDYVCIDRLLGEGLAAKTLAIWFDGHAEDNVEYTLKDTPCGEVVERNICCYPDGVRHQFPQDQVLQDMGAESYLGTTLWGSGGQPIGLIALIGRHPITTPGIMKATLALVSVRAAGELERRDAETKLNESLAFTHELIGSMQDGFSVLDRMGLQVDVNPSFCRMTGFSRDELVGIGAPYPYWPPEEQETIQATLLGTIKGITTTFELIFMRKSGERFPVLVSPAVIRNLQGRINFFSATVKDITERKVVEQALAESEARYRAQFDLASEGIFTLSPEGVVVDVNAAFAAMHGYTKAEMLNMNLKDLDTPASSKQVPERMHRLLAGEALTFEVEHLHKDGHAFPMEVSASLMVSGGATAILCFHRDITERKLAEEEKQNLQAQLQQSQKMESLGTLASGVAHDMNNVLGAILGLASAHIGTQPYGSPLHQALDTICKATERGGKMVKSLLSFSRQSPAESHKLDMNAILREQVSLLERTTLAKVCLQMDMEADLRPILGDASALTHAFMNLCVNAVDAMPENGTLTLHTRNVDNDWIEVVVEDNGMGMPKEVRERAMDPFFTTKGIGKGTGLGLSMVFSTVKAHRGQMDIQSEPGQGTRVRLRFPACEKEAPVQAVALAATEATQIPHGTMKVLLIDDDDLIQSSVQAILEVLGYTAVTTAQSGEEALAALEAGFEPDLVILDMNMPGLGGIGTLPRLRVLRPVVPVLLSTGRVDQTAQALASAHPGVTLLAKPFGLRELQKHLESIGLG